MKIAFLGLSSNLTDITKQEEVINYLKFNILRVGEHVSLISYFNNNSDQINKILLEDFDVIFCIGSDSAIFNYNIKENLAKCLSSRLETNSILMETLKKYCQNKNIVYGSTEELISMIPHNSIPISDSEFYDNGFIFNSNNKYIIFLPSDDGFVKRIYNNMWSIISNNIPNNEIVLTLRCYGLLEKDIRNLICDEINNPNLGIQIINCRLDNIIYIKYNNENSNVVQNSIAEICSKLTKFIYSTDNSNLSEISINLLKMQRKRLILAETLTYGNIALNISKIDHTVIEKTYVFNNFDAITNTLKLDNKVVEQFGKFSVNSVYELDNLLLQNSTSDIAVFVLGDKSSDTCFIAIGDIDGIHVYKNNIMNFDKGLIATLSETTLFYLIKKLRQNDLQFR